MNPFEHKILKSIAADPGDLEHVPPAVVKAAVRRVLEQLPETILGDTYPDDDPRLDRYTLRHLLEQDFVLCEDGSIWLSEETASDEEGATMPLAYWEAAKAEIPLAGSGRFVIYDADEGAYLRLCATGKCWGEVEGALGFETEAAARREVERLGLQGAIQIRDLSGARR